MNKFSIKNLAIRTIFGLAIFVVGSCSFAGQAQAAPMVQTLAATSISNVSVTLNGLLNPQGENTTYWFEYGTSFGNLNQITTQQNAGNPNAQINVYNTIYGLNQNTTYYFRLVAQSQSGFVQGQTLSFQMNNGGGGNGDGFVPVVNTISADVNTNYALLRGDINPGNSSAQVWFRYGQNSGYLTEATARSTAYGGYSPFSSYASNLVPGVTYYYQAVAQNNYGTSYGQVLSFVSSNSGGNGGNGGNNSNLPIVTTNSAISVGRSSALLRAHVNPNGNLTAVWFEYGRSTSLGGVTTRDPAGSATGSTEYSMTINGLAAGTTYYYRAVAQNPNGTNYGQVLSFRTQSAPVVTPVTPAPPTTPVTPTTPVVPTTPTTPVGAPGCFQVGPTISSPQLKANEDFVFSVTYRNNCGYALSNASMQITLPVAVDFASTNYSFLSRDGNVITYNLGSIAQNFQSVVTVNGKVKSQVANGDSLIFQANLTFSDTRGILQTATGYLSAMIVSGTSVSGADNSTSSTLGASIADNLSGLFHSGWFWLVLFLILIALFVFWLATRRRADEEEEEEDAHGHAPAH